MELMEIRRGLMAQMAESRGNILAIISHRSEWIDTDVYPASTNVCIIDAKINNFTTYDHLFGASFDANRFGIQDGQNDGYWVQFLWASVGLITPRPSVGDRFSMVLGSGYTVTGQEEIVANRPLLLFGGYYTGTMENRHIACTFYGLQVVDIGKRRILHHFVPWLDGNEIPCVKDLITNSIKYNSGTGNFGYIEHNGTIHNS